MKTFKVSMIALGLLMPVMAVVWGWRGYQRPPATVIKMPGAELLLIETSNLVVPQDEGDALDLVTHFREAATEACWGPGGGLGLARGLCESLAEAAADRLRLYMAPSYDAYRAYCRKYAGRDPDGSGVQNIISSAEDFAQYAQGLRLLPIDPTAVHIRQIYDRGRIVSPPSAGCSHSPDSGSFFSKVGLAPERTEATIYEVLVPVEYPDVMSPEVRVRVVLGMAFILEGGVWKPWRMGVHDPSGERHVFSPPLL